MIAKLERATAGALLDLFRLSGRRRRRVFTGFVLCRTAPAGPSAGAGWRQRSWRRAHCGAFEGAGRRLGLVQANLGLFFLAQGEVDFGSIEQDPWPLLDLQALVKQLEGGSVPPGLAQLPGQVLGRRQPVLTPRPGRRPVATPGRLGLLRTIVIRDHLRLGAQQGQTFPGIAARGSDPAVVVGEQVVDASEVVQVVDLAIQQRLPILSLRSGLFRSRRAFVIVQGCMIGVELTIDGAPVVKACMERGLLINCTHATVLRLLPAMNLTDSELEEGCAVLEGVLVNLEARALIGRHGLPDGRIRRRASPSDE